MAKGRDRRRRDNLRQACLRPESQCMKDPLQIPFLAGASARGARSGPKLVTAFLFLSLAVGAMTARAFADAERVHLQETRVPFGSWAVEWDAAASSPSVEQVAQTDALRRVAVGVTGLVSLLAFLTLITLRRQEHRLRAAENYVHWAVGARGVQFVARLVGRTWRWAVIMALLAVAAVAVVLRAMESSFPGDAHLPAQWAPFLILTVVIGVLFVNWERRAGERAAKPRLNPLGRLATGPVAVSALGFAVLTAVGLLSAHAPTGDPHNGDTLLTAGVSLDGGPQQAGISEILTWVSRTAETTGPLGVASAGTVRGAGVATRAWVDCGRCFEGGLPMPFKTVRAEVFAVGQDTFPHLGLEVVEGRDFDNGVDVGEPAVAIVSQALARRHFERGEAVGRRIRFGEDGWLTVVGIVTDRGDIRDHMEYAVYLPVTQARPTELEVMGQTSRDQLRHAAQVTSAGISVALPRSLEEVFGVHSWFGQVLSVAGVFSYLLVVLGVWLGASNEAKATEFEISLRKAVGATRADLLRHFLGRTSKGLFLALVAGAWLALFAGVGLSEAYGGIPVADLSVSAWASLPVVAAFVVGFWPSYARSMRRTPSVGLRADE